MKMIEKKEGFENKEYRYYTSKEIEKLIDRYIEAGGVVYTILEGTLGYGITALVNNGKKLKEFIIEEKFLNTWSSTHIIKEYTKLPEEYRKRII